MALGVNEAVIYDLTDRELKAPNAAGTLGASVSQLYGAIVSTSPRC